MFLRNIRESYYRNASTYTLVFQFAISKKFYNNMVNDLIYQTVLLHYSKCTIYLLDNMYYISLQV